MSKKQKGEQREKQKGEQKGERYTLVFYYI